MTGCVAKQLIIRLFNNFFIFYRIISNCMLHGKQVVQQRHINIETLNKTQINENQLETNSFQYMYNIYIYILYNIIHTHTHTLHLHICDGRDFQPSSLRYVRGKFYHLCSLFIFEHVQRSMCTNYLQLKALCTEVLRFQLSMDGGNTLFK